MSGAAAGEMGREPRQSRRSRVNERLRREELVALAPFPRAFGNRFGSRARLSGEPTHKNRQLRRLAFTELPALKLMSCIPTNWIPIGY